MPEADITQTRKNHDRLHVLHVVLSLVCGGMEQVVVDLARLGVEAGQQVDVLCLESPGELAPLLEEMGVPVHCLTKQPGLQLGLRSKIKCLLRSIRPNVIHTHQIGSLFYTGPPARQCGIRAIVHTEHGQEYASRWQTRWLGRLAARHASRFFCVSDDTARHVLRHHVVPQYKIQIIYNGIDIQRFAAATSARQEIRQAFGIGPEGLMVGTVGRLSTIKRQDLLIRAFARVQEKVAGAHLLLVGDGPKRQELTDLAENLGLATTVHFTGYRPDRERYLAALDLFALTSDSEGTPLALLEAWATGLPVVVTTVGGLPELVQEGSTGLLVPPRDVDALAEALIGLLASEPRRLDLGGKGKDLVRARFDQKQMAAQYAEHYTELVFSTTNRNLG